MKILVNRPFTDHGKGIASRCEEISQSLNVKTSVYYSGYLDALNNEGSLRIITDDPSQVIVIVVNDYLANCTHKLNVERLASIPKHFIIVCEVHNAQGDFVQYPNIEFVTMAPSTLANHKQWERVLPQNLKDLVNGPHWISINNNARPQRTMISCILANYGLGIKPNNVGLLRINIENHGARLPIKCYSEWKDWLIWHSQDPIAMSIGQEQKLSFGYSRLENGEHELPNTDHFIPGFPKSLDVATNFDLSLRPLYHSSVLEIVNETVFFNKGVVVSEKYLHTIMGFEFPVIMANPGTVAYLRSLGLDMFDDIIDHFYDEVNDPVYRAFIGLENNLHLLSNPQLAREYWIHCYPRFQKNYNFVKNDLGPLSQAKFETDFINSLSKFR